jgi:hypothetical protein
MTTNNGTTQETKPSKPLQGKKIDVSVDITIDEVIRLDKEGATLEFDTEPDRFLKMKGSQLSQKNRLAYQIAKEIYEDKLEENPYDQIPGDIQFSSSALTAREKLEIPNNPAYQYQFVGRQALQECLGKGWTVVSNEKTSVNQVGHGRSEVKDRNGQTELILIKLPRTEYLKRMKQGDESLDRFMKRTEDTQREQFNRQAAGSDVNVVGNVNLSEAESGP